MAKYKPGNVIFYDFNQEQNDDKEPLDQILQSLNADIQKFGKNKPFSVDSLENLRYAYELMFKLYCGSDVEVSYDLSNINDGIGEVKITGTSLDFSNYSEVLYKVMEIIPTTRICPDVDNKVTIIFSNDLLVSG